MNQDFKEFFALLNAKGVRYLIIGGVASIEKQSPEAALHRWCCVIGDSFHIHGLVFRHGHLDMLADKRVQVRQKATRSRTWLARTN